MTSKTANWDSLLFWLTALLFLFGILMLSSASIGLIGKTEYGPLQIVLKQLVIGGGVGSLLFAAALAIDIKFWRRYSLALLAVSFLMMLAVFIPGIGFEHAGAHRWIKVGMFSAQPSELFKLAFICYLASWLVSRKDEVRSAQFGLVPFLVMTGIISVVFVLQPDVGTLSVIIAASAILFFIGGGRVRHMVLGGLVILFAIAAIIFFEPYRRERIFTYFNPESDITGSGYQMRQALIAIGSGGVFGRGFGESLQKANYLPEAVGDSIFAVVGEEFGFVGASLLVVAFLLFLWRAIWILARVRDPFARLFGLGIVILILIQSFFNMGALSGLLPLTGIPLVFVSQGGTSLAVTLMSVGILLNISRHRSWR